MEAFKLAVFAFEGARLLLNVIGLGVEGTRGGPDTRQWMTVERPAPDAVLHHNEWEFPE